jgi:hypothetical protein
MRKLDLSNLLQGNIIDQQLTMTKDSSIKLQELHLKVGEDSKLEEFPRFNFDDIDTCVGILDHSESFDGEYVNKRPKW